MPSCKNDARRHFKGTEPSPKGRGYCAHADPVGKKRIGLDRKMWIVKTYKTKTGKTVKRWVHSALKVLKKKKISTNLQGGGLYSSAINAANWIYSSAIKNTNQYLGRRKPVPEQVKKNRKRFVAELGEVEQKLLHATGANAQEMQERINGLRYALEYLAEKYPQEKWDWNAS